MTSDGLPFDSFGASGKEPDGPAMGTLVIHIWQESDQARSFRARLMYSQAPEASPKTVATADPEEALGIVRQWLYSQVASQGATDE